MSEIETPPVGTIVWYDLTVVEAEKVRDFYRQVVGWGAEALDMGGYSDFSMLPPGAERPVAGVCHARGGNADLPPQWLAYVVVEDLDASLSACQELGGKVLTPTKSMEGARYAVIQDPAGAVLALYQPPTAA